VYAERSIFPGYLFCKIGSEAIGKIVATPGVLRIVGFGTKPAIVNEEEIASIRTIVSSNVVRAPWKYLPNGCGVLIEDGPLKGVKGVILSDGIGRKLVVSVSLLQRSLAVTIDASTRLRALPLAYQKTSQALGRESQLAMRLAM
jgi:transcription antitermination factor NusG